MSVISWGYSRFATWLFLPRLGQMMSQDYDIENATVRDDSCSEITLIPDNVGQETIVATKSHRASKLLGSGDGSSGRDNSSTQQTQSNTQQPSHPKKPCTCQHHRGCCPAHRSTRRPNRPTSIFSSQLGLPNHKGVLSTTFQTYTLEPIHPVVPYHLSFENLKCSRQSLRPRRKMVLVTDLCGQDEVTDEGGTTYIWSNDIYYGNGTFLQKQEVVYQMVYLHKNRVFKTTNGFQEVKMEITNRPQRCPSHPTEQWSSLSGKHVQMVTCEICHSDAECVLELRSGGWLNARYTCYRELGDGENFENRQWLSLLTGQGYSVRPWNFDVYIRVYSAARRLGRDTESVIHQGPNGAFDAETYYHSKE
ncbi:unnamed protein product [Clonostachys rosea f. rosea IK726]|uniref:Uncharacterized protein n=1 Tax=Clonostachys rosea f. rosea IK726 TaxID=1349383 RepID=A0ACA9UD42_BIOOC|nr:unnamed protein product [Clonostachys rosea f. rosea IK726]